MKDLKILFKPFYDHALTLDNLFEDKIFLSCYVLGDTIVVYSIQHSKDIDMYRLVSSVPKEWKDLENAGKIKIEYTVQKTAKEIDDSIADSIANLTGKCKS